MIFTLPMAKRFTETTKWQDPWFRRLSVHAKALWQWLLDHCDHAGVLQLDIELAAFQIGIQPEEATDALSELGTRVTAIGELHFIPKFIPFQYGTLSTACKAHLPVLRSLEKNNLLDRVSIPFTKGIQRDKEKEKEQEEEKEEGESEGEPTQETVTAHVIDIAPTGVPRPWLRSWSVQFWSVWQERDWRTQTHRSLLKAAAWRHRARSDLERDIREGKHRIGGAPTTERSGNPPTYKPAPPRVVPDPVDPALVGAVLRQVTNSAESSGTMAAEQPTSTRPQPQPVDPS